MIPMEEVRLIWNSEVSLPDGMWLSRDWIPFSRNPHQLHFSFLCEKEDDCLKLKTEMEQVYDIIFILTKLKKLQLIEIKLFLFHLFMMIFPASRGVSKTEPGVYNNCKSKCIEGN